MEIQPVYLKPCTGINPSSPKPKTEKPKSDEFLLQAVKEQGKKSIEQVVEAAQIETISPSEAMASTFIEGIHYTRDPILEYEDLAREVRQHLLENLGHPDIRIYNPDHNLTNLCQLAGGHVVDRLIDQGKEPQAYKIHFDIADIPEKYQLRNPELRNAGNLERCKNHIIVGVDVYTIDLAITQYLVINRFVFDEHERYPIKPYKIEKIDIKPRKK